MNNNVVEKTLKSIDNIDRLSDLAAISIYNTSHEAIDKFDVMQEHATPEYVEGEFVQESLLTGVLIGAGIIGVAISAFLIIKKIIESKAKGDPNAASNTPEGADLTKPEDIQKLFDKWKTEYFNKYPDLVVENVKHADARQMSDYATTLTDSVNQFTDRVNVAVDEYMDNGSEEKLIEHINDIAALIGGADISAALSSEGRIDQSTIGNLEVSAVAIAKSFKEFDGIIKNNIANFEKKAKEKNDKGTEEEGANSKVSEKTIKQFSDILKKKAEETGKIMVSFRKNVLGGFEAAIKAAANEKASSQTKQQTGNGSNGLTDEAKQRILNIMKVYYPEDEKQIIDEINVFDAAESADELKKILDEAYEELKPGKGTKNAFIRIAGVAEQVAAHKHFDWPIRADDYNLNRLDSEDTDDEADIDINAGGSGEGELKNQNTDEVSAEMENSEKHEETPETTETSSDNQLNGETSESGESTSSETPEGTPENQTGEDNIREIVQRTANQHGLKIDNVIDDMVKTLIENNNNVDILRSKFNVDSKYRDKFNKFVDDVAKELGQDVTDETSGEQPKEAADKADNSEPAKDKNAERSDKVNITPEMEEKMKEVLLSAGEISQYGVIDENVVNHEIRQIKDMGLFKWTSGQYGDPNNVMSEQQDRCVKINNARYDAACNLAEIMGIDPDLVPKPTPLEQAATPTKTPEGTPEAEPAKTEAPVNETENKDETSSSENANQNIDIQYDGNWVVINGKPVAYSDEEDDNIERKWPDEDNETANKLITGLINRGESPLNAIEDINDLWEYGSRDGNIINFLNGIYSSRNSLDNPNDLKIRTECYNKCKIMAEILGEPPVDELPKPDSVEKPSDDIKKISDSTGLDEGKVENIYKILKNNSTPDDVKRALIIDTIRPIMHMSGFNEDMTNKSFATNYANFKKVAEAANMPFEIELPKISEKDINDMHTIVDGAGTDETKLAKIADNLMNSTSTEKKDEGVEGDKEQELLSRITNGPTFAAEVAKAVDAGIPEDYARTTLSSLTMSDGKYSLIKERLKDYDWLNDFKQREAYKTAYNHYNDALLYFTDKGIRDIPELKDELPDPTVEFPNALNDENVMQRVLAQYPVNPETLRKDLEYFNTHIPDENLRYIIKDIIPKYFLENAFTKSFEETVNQIRNDDINVLKLAMINANIAEFKPSPEILKQVTDYINANLEKLKSRMTCTILADALVYGTFDPGMIDSETDSGSPKSTAEPKAQPSSPSNSSAGSRSGSKQQPVRKPVNKPGSGSKQQPTKKPKQGLFGKFFGI